MGEYIDDFERMEAENEQELIRSCFNCEHGKIASNKYPCSHCWHREKWVKRKDGEK